MIAILDYLRADDMRAVFCENSLICGLLLLVCELREVSQKLSIDWEWVPKVILTGEEGADREWVLGKNYRVDWGESWVLESAKKFGALQVVEATRAIEAARDK